MDPLTILGLAQGAFGLGKVLFGKKRPEYEIPIEARSALALSKARAADPNMPGQQQLEDQISLTTANTLAAGRESGNIQEVLPAIQSSENKAIRELAIASAEDQRRDEASYQDALLGMSDQKDKEFQMNEFAPYAQNYQEGRQMVGAGIENLNTAYMLSKLTGNPMFNKKAGSSGSSGSGANLGAASNFSFSGGGSGINTGAGSKFDTGEINWDLLNQMLGLGMTSPLYKK